MKQKRNKILLFFAITTVLISCTEEYSSDFQIEKPNEVALNQYLESFDILKNYIDRNTNPNFMLGMGVTSTEFPLNEVAYSQALTNFDEVTPRSGTSHTNIVNSEGEINSTDFQSFLLTARDNGMSVFGSALCWHTEQNHIYLNNLIADIVLPGYTEVLIDFESDNLGETYPMTGNSVATVVNDPKGVSGKVLNIGTETVKANQSFPQFEITLPEGKTLEDAVSLIIDFNATGSTGLHGSGMRMGINDKPRVSFKSASNFGCPSGDWGRGLIQLPFADLNLTEEEKASTNFRLTIGSATGSGYYFIDNISINWRGKTIVKTQEERTEIFKGEIEKFINGMMASSAGYVKAWDVINEPMSDNDGYMLRSSTTDPDVTDKFYWQDYLGDNYARYVIDHTRKYHQEHGGNPDELKLFVNEYGLENPYGRKCERLIQMVNQWEEDGVTKIDGIGTQIQANYSLSPTHQSINKVAIVDMFRQLKSTGKLIRISDLKMGVVDSYDVPIKIADITPEIILAISEYYNFIISAYFEEIPSSQRYGITLRNPNSELGLWNGYNRIIPYSGFSKGLEKSSFAGN